MPWRPAVMQVEEWGEAYQALSWGPLIELVKADLQPSARKDKASRRPSVPPYMFLQPGD